MALDSDKYFKLFKDRHGYRYDYSEVVFGKSESKIKIVCKVHGSFSMAPRIHAKGHGCPECGKTSRARSKRRNSSAKFIQRSVSVHGTRYDYSKSEYKRAHEPVIITCRDHGDFSQCPSSHWRGVGCPKCGGVGKLSNDEFISRAKEKHGDTYDYSEVLYVNLKTKVSIICRKHGAFLQAPNAHIRSDGCPECSKSKPLNTETFIKKSVKIHGSVYDYSCSKYSGAGDKIAIKCKTHGVFHVLAYKHYNGVGCPKCSGPDRKCYVYLIGSSNRRCKVGVSVDVDRRFRELKCRTPDDLELLGKWAFSSEQLARYCEKAIHDGFSDNNSGLTGFDGCTEYFDMPPYILADFIKALGGEPET